MEVIWYILGGVAWLIGVILTLWDIGTDKTIRQDFAEFQASIDDENEMLAWLLSMLLCVLIVLICAFWPIFTVATIGRRILRKVVRK